jgi:hypothetical protein
MNGIERSLLRVTAASACVVCTVVAFSVLSFSAGMGAAFDAHDLLATNADSAIPQNYTGDSTLPASDDDDRFEMWLVSFLGAIGQQARRMLYAVLIVSATITSIWQLAVCILVSVSCANRKIRARGGSAYAVAGGYAITSSSEWEEDDVYPHDKTVRLGTRPPRARNTLDDLVEAMSPVSRSADGERKDDDRSTILSIHTIETVDSFDV